MRGRKNIILVFVVLSLFLGVVVISGCTKQEAAVGTIKIVPRESSCSITCLSGQSCSITCIAGQAVCTCAGDAAFCYCERGKPA